MEDSGLRRRTHLGLLAVLLAVPVLVTTTMRAQLAGSTEERIYACVNNASGTIHVINPTSTCAANEIKLDWNQVGPPGPKGDKGDPGPAGPAGPAGPQGPKGDPGPVGAVGLPGPPGVAGVNGMNGANGRDGATWLTGSDAPAGTLGAANDLYLATSTGDYYKKTDATTWAKLGTLTAAPAIPMPAHVAIATLGQYIGTGSRQSVGTATLTVHGAQEHQLLVIMTSSMHNSRGGSASLLINGQPVLGPNGEEALGQVLVDIGQETILPLGFTTLVQGVGRLTFTFLASADAGTFFGGGQGIIVDLGPVP